MKSQEIKNLFLQFEAASGEIEGVEVYGKSRLADDINTKINN